MNLSSRTNFDAQTSALKDTLVNFIIPLISLGATAFLVLVIFYPSYRALPKLKHDKEAKEVLNNTLESKRNTLKKLLDYMSVVDENSALVKDVLVEVAMVPELLTQIDMIATESGLEVTKMNYSFTDLGVAPTVNETEVSTATSSSYKVVNVTMGAKGNMEQFTNFLRNLENSARLVDVESFRYSNDTSEESTGLVITFDLKSPYLFVESTAVTDDAVTLDITDPEFTSMINKIKGLKYYRISIDEISSKVVQEASESAEEKTTQDVVVEEEDALEDNPFGGN
ncbi:MAG: hypothetical protein UU77_C0010G0019 [candidate division WWE3 bacterium GW2011_GWC1_41_7]|uniref:Type IV pilus assembly protein PilO n=3 Tax=Katanobacteria TaxID=422282 RepID=A0A0G0X7S4_UNCKA|nr:MAG: hypothetical protein UU72_C0010G0035 [candidate division WWE3 bacterium GW2011_GWB1_41_6]KKS20995.1 MAG: hypothetical protein UU77_C0010G0019 [candidate division WWE3 bacterium GW2011_GWC1_41_7]OGC56501.1 MAG: hypothetical protein A2976_02830 [candidate division WWE3 bacterium RIFCSPLOWO2_01_FULL_41_9]